VEVQNNSDQYVPCRELVDSASHSHIVTERCLQLLRLSRNKTHAQLQGISSVNTETFRSVSFQLRSKHRDWYTTFNCAILSHIIVSTTSAKLDTSTWKIPKDIKFSDDHFKQPGDIVLHIGADLFYEMLRSGRITRPDNHSFSQEICLDWSLSARTPTTSTQHDPQTTFLLRKTTVCSTI